MRDCNPSKGVVLIKNLLIWAIAFSLSLCILTFTNKITITEDVITQEGKAEAITAAEEIVRTTRPTVQATTEPTTQPTTKPTTQPTTKPTAQPTTKPTAQPTTKPTTRPETTTEGQPTTESQPKVESTTEQKTQPAKKRGDGISITDSEYDYLCRIVMGEAGDEPYDGQILVAQCLYNAMAESGKNAWDVKSSYGYCGSTSTAPTKSVKNAVAAVFYDGYRYTNEKVLYFYAPELCSSGWHETQKFVCEVGGHRFFARW